MTQTQPNKQFVSAGAHRICYVEGGRPGMPIAVLAHGWIASHQLYRRVWAELGELFHFYAIDLPGFGDSDKPDPAVAAYDAPFFADTLRAFVDAIGIGERPFTLMAQSMGGMAAVEFACRWPQRLAQLILIDCAGIAMPPPLLGRIVQAPLIGRPLFMALGSTRKALTDFLNNDIYHVKEVFETATVDNMLRVVSQPNGKAAAYAAMMHTVAPAASRAFAPRFAQVKVPTKVLWGEFDRLFPLKACGETICAAIPGARLHVVKGSGHEPPVETPAAFIAALKEAIA